MGPTKPSDKFEIGDAILVEIDRDRITARNRDVRWCIHDFGLGKLWSCQDADTGCTGDDRV